MPLNASVSMAENTRLNLQGGSKHTATFHSVEDWEGFRGLSVVFGSAHHSIVELSDDGDKLSWASVLRHNFPKTPSTNSVEGLVQIDIGAVLLKLSSSKHYINSPAFFPKAALAFR